MQPVTFGKGRSERVEIIKYRQMRVELRALLNETMHSMHPGSEEFGKIRKFMKEYLIAPNEEWDVRNFERTYKNNTGTEL